MNTFSKLLFYSIIMLLSSCGTISMEGLWIVEKVNVGKQEMTPQARWMRFEKDFTQQSGNGWFQHSIGTWEYNRETKALNIVNENGYLDPNEPFKVKMGKEKMYWNREEDGQQVTVILKKIDKIPQSQGNKLLGVWNLEKVTEEDRDVTKNYDPNDTRYLFMRWDNIFMIRNSPEGRMTGVYKIHGHRPEIEMIFNGNDCKKQQWTFEVHQKKLILTLIHTDKKIKMEYKRINYFPE